MRSIIQYLNESEKETFRIPMITKKKNKKLNPKTNRIKTFKTNNYLETNIPIGQRSFKNLPKYADRKPKVRFQDWFEIKSQKTSPSHDVTSWGWSPNGKCYGWSHRAVHGFSIGDKVTKDTGGNDSGKEFILKTREQVQEMAIKFAKSVS
jgi:hypothetical protein